MKLENRIRELEKQYPAMREMEVKCNLEDGSTEWIPVHQLADRHDVITFDHCRHGNLPDLDKLLQFLKEAANA